MTDSDQMQGKKTIRAIVFDKDGTLFEFAATWSSYCNKMFDQMVGDKYAERQKLADACGYDMEREAFVPGSIIVGGSIEDLCVLWAETSGQYSTEQVLDFSRKIIENLTPAPICDLNKLTKSLLDLGLKLGVITNDLENAAHHQLKQEGVEDRFAVVFGSDSGHTPKPAPDTLLAFCRQTDLTPEEIAMVGDSLHDLKAARACGAGLSIGVLTGPADLKELAPMADAVLTSIEELPDFLRKYCYTEIPRTSENVLTCFRKWILIRL